MNTLSTSTFSNPMGTVADLVDAVSFDALSDLDAPDFSAISDALSDASSAVADTALVISKHSGRLATRSARMAWRNRRSLATATVLVLAVLGAVAIWRRRSDDDSVPTAA